MKTMMMFLPSSMSVDNHGDSRQSSNDGTSVIGEASEIEIGSDENVNPKRKSVADLIENFI